ncbi:Odorant receptor 193 [Nylanderia fulva]|uniref:Odorant receptor n=1 Tax=Nylanderia fulva TaxID=613905 RepID=A0A6G1LP99_9HYME|nr:Odorant receptor 193 [Nylanderia fulva]
MKTNWNNGIDYGFSTVRSMMWILGLWPLQNGVIYTIQWLVIFVIVSLTLINTLIEAFISCDAPRDGLETLRLTESCIHAWLNIIFPRIYMKKLAVNINSAVDDWLPSTKKELRVIMMGYARAGRLVALTQLIFGCLGGTLWFTSVFLVNKDKVATIENNTAWNFVIPSTCIYNGISYSTYKAIFVMQIIQGFLVLISECACDSFFFSITMHLCGQVELLRVQFIEVFRKRDGEKHCENIFGPVVRRHCQLIELNRNIEDAFNINILLRLLIISVVIAVSGVGIILSINRHDYKELIKMVTSINFFIIQAFLYTYAGDILQNQSESIFYAIYNSTWHEMSPTMVKDLIFIMMKMKIPFRISAGKFFYLARTTMTDILKTTLTYISFLQFTVNN